MSYPVLPTWLIAWVGFSNVVSNLVVQCLLSERWKYRAVVEKAGQDFLARPEDQIFSMTDFNVIVLPLIQEKIPQKGNFTTACLCSFQTNMRNTSLSAV